MTQPLDDLTRLYRACEPNMPVQPPDPRYVNCDDVRGENLVETLARSLRLSSPEQPECKLFAGHRGVGKTSELLRLKGLLDKENVPGSPPFQVIFADVGTSLDVNDLDLPDLLVFTAAEVQKQLKAAQIPGFTATSQLLQRWWDDLKELLGSNVTIKEASIDVQFGKLALELRNRPSARSMLRNEIERQATNLIDAVNDLLLNAVVHLRAAGKAGLVVIIDGLDKLVYRRLDGGQTNTHDRLFLDRSEQMASLQAHTIYTVPISLFYSPRCAQLEQTFGEFNRPVAMIRVRGDGNAVPAHDTLGMQKLWEMVKARCDYASVNIDNAFESEETCQYLCQMTGGHPRHLMMFLQSAITRLSELPITRRAAERAVADYANSLSREVPTEFWPSLRAFDQPGDTIPKDEMHQQMLLYLHVFEYMNGQPWYEVNPVLRTLPQFQA
jgi:hypothetical protein